MEGMRTRRYGRKARRRWGSGTVLPTGEWMPVPNDKINNVLAPDGGAHVCAPRQVGPNKGVLCHSAVRGLRALRNVRYPVAIERTL
jgi:hypothetical protein